MKIKYILLIAGLFFICGCQNVREDSIENIVSVVGSPISKYNTYHTGFKYYLPNGMSVDKESLYNAEISTSKYVYYLYVDVISYYNKTKSDYKINKEAYYSAILSNDEKQGYIEINSKENNQYLIEIMFNYAKIEVMVDYEDVNLALEYAVSLLRSISYNDVVIASLVSGDVLSFDDEVYNIFDKANNDSNYIKVSTEDTSKTEEEKYKDPDLIN